MSREKRTMVVKKIKRGLFLLETHKSVAKTHRFGGRHGVHGVSGFTLIELLVVLGVIAILFSLLLPALAKSRLAATKLACMSRIRDLGNLVALYTAEHDEKFPNAMGDGPDVQNNPDQWQKYTFQVYSTFPREPWLSWAGLNGLSEILYCPANRVWPNNLSDTSDAGSEPDYMLSASVFAQTKYFDPDLPDDVWKSKLGAKVQRISAAVFPDRKVGVIEVFVWQGWKGTYCKGCDVGSLEYYQSDEPGSLWFMDGHVDQIHSDNALPFVYRYPIWPYDPFGTTNWGMAGRDIQ